MDWPSFVTLALEADHNLSTCCCLSVLHPAVLWCPRNAAVLVGGGERVVCVRVFVCSGGASEPASLRSNRTPHRPLSPPHPFPTSAGTATYSMDIMIFIAFWASFTLIIRLGIISIGIATLLFHTKVGMYDWGLKYCKKQDDAFCFGVPLVSTLYGALYDADREKRIERAHEPLNRRSTYEVAKLNVKRLRRDKKRMKEELKEVRFFSRAPASCALPT